MAAAANIACGAWPHAAAPSAASSSAIVRHRMAHRRDQRATPCARAAGQRRPSHGKRTNPPPMLNTLSSVSVRESQIQYLCDPQWFRDTAIRGPTTIVAPESQFRTCPSDHESIGYPRMSASGESSTTMHRLLHASGSHPIPPPNDPNDSMFNRYHDNMSNRYRDIVSIRHRQAIRYCKKSDTFNCDSYVFEQRWAIQSSSRKKDLINGKC
ncbi:hypothetical protein F511_40999 [Dorcoceras hygrometricum]|uniref:Uncharacterized protein n=1 Tax=Dorcoceras hygrometricum TaxID=472368 RepID=A0A2Z7D775_9LAMI|nr:hypothetical protein F511_40999 [Dorcoceras hygrometricum]